MELHYYRDPHGNFGDDINKWLWRRLVPDWWDQADDTCFCGIGTLIDSTMPRAKRWIVFSSGAGYGPPPPNFGDETWTISCVRGPLTARVLDLPAECAVSDGALLIATLPEYRPLSASERSGVLFMPHHNALKEGAWDLVCARAGVEFVSPRDDDRSSIERIRRARLILADAMHAAIIADCLRVPWVPVMTSPEINAFKWLDWCLSLKLPYEPTALPGSSTTEQVQSWFLPLYGHKYALRERTVEAAIRHFHRHRAMKSLRYWWMVRDLARASFARVVRPALLAEPVRGWRRGNDERSVERAAHALSRLSSHPGFLSDERTLASKQDELLSRLGELDKASRPRVGLAPAW
jgi:succinoglycan biosynthesis protein ExoV